MFQFVECALGAVRRVTELRSMPDDFKETVTLARLHRMLPDDGPKGPKHVGAIYRDILNTNCNILCFNKKVHLLAK